MDAVKKVLLLDELGCIEAIRRKYARLGEAEIAEVLSLITGDNWEKIAEVLSLITGDHWEKIAEVLSLITGDHWEKISGGVKFNYRRSLGEDSGYIGHVLLNKRGRLE